MILDSSAIVGMLRKEPGYESLAEKVLAAGTVGVGTPTLVETEIVLVGRFDRQGRVLLRNFVVDKKIDVISFGEQHWREAGRAFVHYGKGRHRAALNLGDCMTYATARLAGEPLLCLGEDFALTDLELAQPPHASQTRLRHVSYDGRASWSPEGKQIAYTARDGSQVEVMNSDGSDKHLLPGSPNGEVFVAWAPDSLFELRPPPGQAPVREARDSPRGG